MSGDIGEWLEGLGLGRYVEAFAENEIDFDALGLITEDDLKEIGVALGARRKLLAAAAALGTAAAEAPEKDTAPGPASEQRQVTVLFADLAGFTTLSDELGAEATLALLNRYFETVDSLIEGYGGSIDKHMGDNVMALFGAPIAHSNDPERAARAALHIHQAMVRLSAEFGRPLKAHIGLASGQVVASGTGSAAHREYTVTGSSVNLASRLQDKAEAGETLISRAVQQAIAQLAETAALGEIEVKGFAEPVRVWRLEGLSDDGAGARLGPLVGRRSEQRQFEVLLRDCLEIGSGQSLLLRGEAGIGKTRLIEVFAALAETEGFAIHKGMVLDFGVGKGQDVVRALLRSLLGLAGGSDKATRVAAAERSVEAGWLDAEARVFLNDLLDLSQPLDLRALYDAMDNATRNAGKRAVVAKLIGQASKACPLLIMVEDVHWADALTLAQLAVMASTVAASPAVLVMTSRVEGDPLDQAWRASLGGSPLTTMDLQPLRASEVEELAGSLVETGGALVRDCIARAEGNPLFLEQLLRNAEEGTLTEVPGSIQSLVLARMDRLGPRDKQALQAASVIGKRFEAEALRAVLEDAAYDCRALMEHHLVRPEGEAYLFAHALIQEGVYSSLLQAQRRGLHRRAAACFADHDPVLNAEHLDRAEDEAAPPAYLQAAKAEAAAFRFDGAFGMAERGLALARSDSDRLHLGLVKAEFLRELGRIEEAVAVFHDLLELTSDDITRCRVWIGIASCMRLIGGQDEGMRALDAAEPLARRCGAALELSQVSYYRGCLFFTTGDVDGCLAQHEQARDAAMEAGDPEGEARALSGLGDAYYGRGEMRLAREQFSRCRRICRQHGFGRIEVGSTQMIGVVRRYLNEFTEAIEDLRAAASVAAKVGNARTEMMARMILGELLVDGGDIEGAYGVLDRALAIAETFNNKRYRAYILYEFGRGLWCDPGRRDEAEPTLADALGLCRETGMAFVGPRVLAAKAVVSQNATDRRALLEEGEAVIGSGCLPHVVLWYYRDAIEASLSGSDWENAERYAAALADFTRAEPLPWAEFFIARGRALAAFGRGRRDEATGKDLCRLHHQGETIGLKIALPALEKALAAM